MFPWDTGGMYTVELYARVRRAVHVEGRSQRDVARGVRAGPQDGAEDAGVFGSARVSAAEAGAAPEAGTVAGCLSHHKGSKPRNRFSFVTPEQFEQEFQRIPIPRHFSPAIEQCALLVQVVKR